MTPEYLLARSSAGSQIRGAAGNRGRTLSILAGPRDLSVWASSWIDWPVRLGRYLLASVETENGKRNKPDMINDCA